MFDVIAMLISSVINLITVYFLVEFNSQQKKFEQVDEIYKILIMINLFMGIINLLFIKFIV